MTNTELSAKAEQIAQNTIFMNQEHKKFFLTYLPQCRYADSKVVKIVGESYRLKERGELLTRKKQ